MNQRASDKSLLLSVQVPLLCRGDELLIEEQSCNGIERYLDSFDRLTLIANVLYGERDACPAHLAYRPVSELPCRSNVDFVGLPEAWSYSQFMRSRRAVQARVRPLVLSHRYMMFSIGGYLGDWGRVVAGEAIRHQQAYVLWRERVESSVGWITAEGLLGKFKFLIDSVPRTISDRLISSKAAAVLCQGQDTVDAYRRLHPHTYQMTNVHTRLEELPTCASLCEKADGSVNRSDLRIVYAGRVAREKAPLLWVEALHAARRAGCRFTATWYGDGPMRLAADTRCRELGMSDCVRFPGHDPDRGRIRGEIARADVLLFTHISREPSRIVVESLNNGTPIVGFKTARVVALTDQHGGGAFAPMKDPQALGQLLANISSDRIWLAGLIRAAGVQGREYTSEACFAARCRAIVEATDRVQLISKA